MSSAARIEELQKKFDENPRRYFAPLANECRKAGELDAAIAICRAHLPQQPGHMSGHIVYGQALFESGELVEAKSVFETALGLDPENLIALRHMGDIAARNGNPIEARQWYTRVLETDPRNEEIQGLVAALDGAEPGELAGLPSLMDPALVAAAADATPDEVTPDDASPFAGAGDELVPTALGEEAEGSGAEAFTLDGFEATSFDAPQEPVRDAPIDLEFDVPDADAARDIPALDGLEPTVTAGEPDAGYPPLDLVDDDFAVPAGARGEAPSAEETIAAPTFDYEPADDTPLQDPPEPAPSNDAFVTETMAELYLRQGYTDQALDVYRQLVAQSPDDVRLRERMERVEADLASSARTEADDTVPGLPRMMDPALVAAAAGETVADDAPVAASSSRLTIREYLAALASGQPPAVAMPAPTEYGDFEELDTAEQDLPPMERAIPEPVVDAATWDVTTVVAVSDVVESAAEVTVPNDDIPAPGEAIPSPAVATADEGSAADGGLDALFESGPSAGDVAAADTLASAFLPTPPGQPPAGSQQAAASQQADPLSGRPARPAGNDLSLDHVFGAPRQPGSARNTGGFSFDQFFAEGAVASPRDDAAEPGATAGDEEDLEQFNSWLHNLKNQ